MSDIIYYLGNEVEDFSAISAAFKQMAREFEIHFAAFPEDVMARLNAGGCRPSVIFVATPAAGAIPLLPQLKMHHVGCWIPTVLIGDGPQEAHCERLASCGAAAYLRRPLHTDAIQRLFSASGEFLFRPDEDAALLSFSS